jgi:YVTN family beta-propeller protein
VSISLNRLLFGIFLILTITAGSPAFAAEATAEPAVDADEASVESSATAAQNEEQSPNMIHREGVKVEFSVTPVKGPKLIASDWADVTFRITDENTGEPIKGRYPAAWMDLGEAWEAKGGRPMECRQKVETYLKGIVGVRPMINLNDHFLLVMNRDSSISVIDPAVGITGVTNLFAQINLDRPAADWTKTADEKRIFATMPLASQVSLIDTEDFKVTDVIDAGYNPTRVELQADERYLWVGNNSAKPEDSGVTVIDTADLTPVAFIPTGLGHHEIAFSDDTRYAFVSNRDSGTVSVIDVQGLKKVKDIETGKLPISMGFSSLGKALYVSDGKEGVVTVIDPESLEIRKAIKMMPGLGPLRFANDGRWGVVVNPTENAVFIIDAATDTHTHTIPVGSQPYQVNFTKFYAYIRSLGSEQVGLINLNELDGQEVVQVQYFTAGSIPPGRAAEISIADSIIPSVKEAAAYVVNQAEGTVHYYMEGMTAPMGAFRNYGHEARAIEIVDRSLTEKAPGVYTGRVKIPVEGIYDVAFMMDTPRFLHCFNASVEPNPLNADKKKDVIGVEYLHKDYRMAVDKNTAFKFRLINTGNGNPVSGLSDVQVLYYAVAGGTRKVVPAKPIGDGIYEAEIKMDMVTTYYFFVGAPSANVKFNDLPFASLIALPESDIPKPKGDKS